VYFIFRHQSDALHTFTFHYGHGGASQFLLARGGSLEVERPGKRTSRGGGLKGEGI